MISSPWRPGFVKLLVIANAVALLAVGSYRAPAETKVNPPKRSDAEVLRRELVELGKARADAAQKTFDNLYQPFRTGMGIRPEPEQVYQWSRRWLEAELDNCGAKSERIACYERHSARMKQLQDDLNAVRTTGRVTPARETAADYYWSDAKFWLGRAKCDQ